MATTNKGSSSASSRSSCALFCWGFGKYGQLGTGNNSTKETPQLIVNPSFNKDTVLSTVSCGGHYTLLVSTASKTTAIYSCGRGLYGRLGNGSEDDQNILKPLPIIKDHSIASLSAGHWHGCYVNTLGQLYIWGYNKAHGVLGMHGQPDAISIPTHIPNEVTFSSVSCGFNYTIALSVDGLLYSWGSGRHGVLGHGDYNDRISPTLIPHLSSIIKLHCGYCHVAAISTVSKVYTWGKGSDGALGHGRDKSDKLSPCLIVATSDDWTAIDVSCSQGEHHSHTLMATDKGEVYSWGDGYKSKLGHGDDTSKDVPTRIDPVHFKGYPIAQVSCGGIHSVALSTDTAVFTWGCGSDGRLGHPEAHGHRYLFLSNVPRLVEGLGEEWKPFAISCSYYHTATLCRHSH